MGRLGLGCFPLTGGYGRADRAESIRTVKAALDLGVDLFDTSDAYAGGRTSDSWARRCGSAGRRP